MNVKAIETVYKGYRFRSRLEARWAVFFDALGLEWEYEVEGFDLNDTWYLPDFYLPHCQLWIEIKPSSHLDDETPANTVMETALKLGMLAQLKGEQTALITGQPWPSEYKVFAGLRTDWSQEADAEWEGPDTVTGVFGVCRKCEGGLWVIGDEGAFSFGGSCCDRHGDKYPLDASEKLNAAYTAARSARFEYGETPRIQG